MNRSKVIDTLNKAISERIGELNAELAQLREGLASDTKNTSGDKHETSRAMNQLEQERLGNQLIQAEEMQLSIKRIAVLPKTEIVQNGSLIKMNNSWYLLATAFGKLSIDSQLVFVLSQASPIGQQVIGKKKGDRIRFNGTEMLIEEIQ
ncbi:MAG: hypothetical protein EP333_04625 [Bacteroidetes bacterium]|nr:MAG: hypothetical protein EP333_04625 [Bacteroidota bacterium]TNF00080.1 MAG: hypothetical protein EP322_02040 [Bacteroidota bacterium]